jgi:hypothetical protein
MAPRRYDAPAMKYRNRVRGYAMLAGSRIRPAPRNFRLHPPKQRAALRGLLAEIGVAGAVLVWVPDVEARERLRTVEQGDILAFLNWLRGYTGDFVLYDGHLRAEEVRDQPLPALVTDLDEEEAAEALATYDAVSDLAEFDRTKFVDLAGEFRSSERAVRDLVDDLSKAEDKARRGRAELEDIEIEEPDLTTIPDTTFFLSVRGPLPAQPDALDRLREALEQLPGCKVEVGIS